ncbi:MAG: hypothetical protein IT168_02085 [Bryobacterales bacterium]|nr:hypothetical protein [Bryobacterales bacterium]
MNRNPLHFAPEELDFQISLLRLVTTAHQEWSNQVETVDEQLEHLQEVTGEATKRN